MAEEGMLQAILSAVFQMSLPLLYYVLDLRSSCGGRLVHKQMLNSMLPWSGGDLLKSPSCPPLTLQLADSSKIFKAELRRQEESGQEEEVLRKAAHNILIRKGNKYHEGKKKRVWYNSVLLKAIKN